MNKKEETVVNLYINSLFDLYKGNYSLKKSAPFIKIVKFFDIYDWINTTAYYRNLNDLKCQYTFFLPEGEEAFYDTIDNVIKYKNTTSIIHELFHMASNPYRCKAKSGFVTSSEENVALDEGITEYFATLFETREKKYYPIEILVVEILAYSNDIYIFKDYFTADYQSFLNQFPNLEAINRLSKKLDIHYMEYDNTSSKFSPLQQKKIELLQKDIIKDILTIIYENELNKKNNNLDELSFIVEDAIKSRKIENGYIAQYDLLNYANNIIKSLQEKEKKKRR